MSADVIAKYQETIRKRANFHTTVFSQIFSPCGNYLAACNNYGKIAVFSVSNALSIDATDDSRKPCNSFKAHNGCIYALASTPGFLISGGTSEIHGWKWKDVIHCKDPRPSWTLKTPSSSPYDVSETNGLAYDSQNSTLISGGGDSNVYVWDLETGETKTVMSGHKDYIHSVACLEKTNQCASGSEDGTVRLWDCRASNAMSSMLEPNNEEAVKRPDVGKWISCVAFDDTEQWLVCGGGPYLSCWHISSATMTAVLPTPNARPLTAVYHEDKILSGGTKPAMFHWSVNGTKEAEIPVAPTSVYSLAINKHSQTNKVLSISGDSSKMEVCTNFRYQAFSFVFKN